ncbi:hypothetical protein BESB_039630 [Besnoitia besnoiti]|uniref:Uncharacterized protein n=1 Tax=Besnoitia besnoiti TaxID=94643 RepID=A0A2A9MHP0_BESBE|nr:hypothetical protein BESB_039630 [Besnoitia besnoiti]PFH37505.1 hypothetical protein BESB_039630 [Besnoitia besnoiti]
MAIFSAVLILFGATTCFATAQSSRSERILGEWSKEELRPATVLGQISTHHQPHSLRGIWPHFAEQAPQVRAALVNADSAAAGGVTTTDVAPLRPAKDDAAASEPSPANDYLIVPHTRTYCEGKSILLAEDASTVG